MSESHGAHSESHGSHPLLPEVRDEAGSTPRWVPILGICLFSLMALWAVARIAGAGETTEVGAPAATEVEPAAAPVAVPARVAAEPVAEH